MWGQALGLVLFLTAGWGQRAHQQLSTAEQVRHSHLRRGQKAIEQHAGLGTVIAKAMGLMRAVGAVLPG